MEIKLNPIPTSFKVALFGAYGVGKSSIFGKMTAEDEGVRKRSSSMFSTRVASKKIFYRKEECEFQVYDTDGLEKYDVTDYKYFKDKQGLIFVFDITRRETFVAFNDYMKSVAKNHSNYQLMIVGNKLDLGGQRTVLYEEGRALAKEYRGYYYEASAKNEIEDFIIILYEMIPRLRIRKPVRFLKEPEPEQLTEFDKKIEQFIKMKKQNVFQRFFRKIAGKD